MFLDPVQTKNSDILLNLTFEHKNFKQIKFENVKRKIVLFKLMDEIKYRTTYGIKYNKENIKR